MVSSSSSNFQISRTRPTSAPPPVAPPPVKSARLTDTDGAEERTQENRESLDRQAKLSAGEYSYSQYVDQLRYWSEKAAKADIATELAEMAAGGHEGGGALMVYLQKYDDPLERYLLLQIAMPRAAELAHPDDQTKARQVLGKVSDGVLLEHRDEIEAGLAVGTAVGVPRNAGDKPMALAEAKILRGWVVALRRESKLVDAVFKIVSDCDKSAKFKERMKRFLSDVGPEVCQLSSLGDPEGMTETLMAISTAQSLLFGHEVVQEHVVGASPRRLYG